MSDAVAAAASAAGPDATWPRELGRVRGAAMALLASIYVVAAFVHFFSPFEPMAIIPFHVYATVAVVLLAKPLGGARWLAEVDTGTAAAATLNAPADARPLRSGGVVRGLPSRRLVSGLVDGVLVLVCLALCWHYTSEAHRLQVRMQYVDEVFLRDHLALFAGLIVLLEGVRRQVGMVLLSLLIACLLYAYFGYLVPGPIGFSGFSLREATEILSMQTLGIFDVPAQVGLNIITLFVVFGAVFTMTGGGAVFIDIAFRLTGRLVGGAAKSAVVGSAMFGTVSGSAVANVSTTGVLTIPLMRRGGLTAEQAAATEAISSSGGQLMPPIMGTAVFVMAQILGRPYIEVAMAGLIPALAFYFALFMTIDLRARRTGALERVERDMPPLGPRLHLLAGPIALVIALFAGYSANYAAVIGVAAALLAPFLRAATRPSWRTLGAMLPSAGRQAAEIAVACTSVGIVMAVAIQSSLVLKFVALLASMGGGSLALSLGLVILGCIVMGMGMPTVAAYIVGSVLFVPALTELGVGTLSAHYFILYYCVLSMVTPPVALTAYAAAGLSGANVLRTSLLAFSYGLVMFVIPFGFVRDGAILGEGEPVRIALAFAGMMLATLSWAVFLQAWLGRRLRLVERAAFGALSFALIIEPSDSWVWLACLAALLGLGAWCLLSARALAPRVRPSEQGGTPPLA